MMMPQAGAWRKVWRLVKLVSLGVVGPVVLLLVFGFFIKTTEEYACAIEVLQHNSEVVREVGDPLRPGLFAWTTYFESGGGTRQGAFSTTLSGPRGRVRAQVQFYRSPVGDTLTILARMEGNTVDVYDGPYPCP